jgi:hypothetical protein
VAAAIRDAEDVKVKTFLTLGREVLKPKLGARYSVAWKEVGFVNNSLALARSMDGRVGQLRALQLYLEAHPELEAPGFVTAAFAGDLHTSAVAAMSDLDIAMTTQRQKTTVRNAATVQLFKRARDLFLELRMLLPANDPRWIEFGFNVPADISKPSAPEGLAVVPTGNGLYAASWEHTIYADRYNLWQQVVGVDAEPVKIDTVTKTSTQLIALPTGKHVKFYLTAVNASGESVPSEIVEVTVP